MSSHFRRAAECQSAVFHRPIDEWVAELTRLQEAATLCPRDIQTRCELAALLERLEQHEDALCDWQMVLACDANNLKAREGISRCRRHSGSSLQLLSQDM